MNYAELEKAVNEQHAKDMETLNKKNHDYAPEGDALHNLRPFGFFGVIVRLSDKFSRLEAFAQNRSVAVKEETILDTLADIRNYCHLAEVLYRQEHPTKEENDKVPYFSKECVEWASKKPTEIDWKIEYLRRK